MVAVVLVLVAVGGVYLALDAIVKSVVEKEGTAQLKVQTTLSGVSLGLFRGTVGLDTFAIASPAGFTAPEMFSVGKLSVDSGGIGNLRGEPVRISTIAIDAPVLVVENHGTTLNFKALIDGLPSDPDNGQPQPSGSEKPATKLLIDSLTISNAHVRLQSDIPGLTQPLDVALPTMTMQKIGTANGAENGVALKDVVVAVITRMVAETTHSPGVPTEVQVLLTGNLDQVQDKLTGAAQNELGKLKLPGNLNNAAGKAAGGAINQGMNLLKQATGH